ncbi:MAG: hypothetical protein WCI56_07830 [Hyphomicrobiales bacterium]
MRMRIACLLIALIGLAAPAQAQSDSDRYTIMRPEPGMAPKYKSPRGSKQNVEPVKPPVTPEPRNARAEQPPVMLPGGKVVPNLPVSPDVPPTARESAQDRTIRCTHQAGVFGVAPEQRNLYISTCANQ